MFSYFLFIIGIFIFCAEDKEKIGGTFLYNIGNNTIIKRL